MKSLCRDGLLLVLALLMVQCASIPASRSAYERDGKQYGKTSGAFRGRWWNYYERGCSFADGRFWKEAEGDLRLALLSRTRDQYWARTYGLHFTPEYFPHRELGVVLFQQGRVEEAMAELEASLEQRHSARAAYYLDEARKAWIEAKGSDKAPPSVALDLSQRMEFVSARTYTISGVARDDTFVKAISVNGVPCPVSVSASEVAFAQDVPLQPGDNLVRIVVEDITGKRFETSAPLVLDVDGPALSFEEPIVIPGVLTGVVYDPSGISVVKVGGMEVTLAPAAKDWTSFRIEVPLEGLVPPLTYEATDTLGNATRGLVPVDTLIVSRVPQGAIMPAAGLSFSRLSNGLGVWTVGGQLIALSAPDTQTASGTPVVKFANLAAGQNYRLDEIVVGLDINAEAPVAKAQVNGLDLATIPGRGVQHVSRRIALEPGSNSISAAATDAQGRHGAATVEVERQLTDVEQVSSRLAVALLGNVWKGNSPQLENETQIIVEGLERELRNLNRFTFVERSALPQIIAEQELSAALGDKEKRLALGKVVPAEFMLIGQVRRDAASLEIVVQGVSSETGLIVARADVAGPADNMDQLDRLVKDLALRVVQEFPRAQGQIALLKNADLFVSNLGEASRVRESMKCIVFRYGEEIKDPATGVSLGRDTTILSEALVRSVASKTSVAERSVPQPGQTATPLLVGDHVVTK